MAELLVLRVGIYCIIHGNEASQSGTVQNSHSPLCETSSRRRNGICSSVFKIYQYSPNPFSKLTCRKSMSHRQPLCSFLQVWLRGERKDNTFLPVRSNLLDSFAQSYPISPLWSLWSVLPCFQPWPVLVVVSCSLPSANCSSPRLRPAFSLSETAHPHVSWLHNSAIASP